MSKKDSLPFKIGNWLIKEDGIYWDGNPDFKGDYDIPKTSILDERNGKFDWLLQMAGKGTLSDVDIHALNAAFAFALSWYNLEIPEKLSFIATIREVNIKRSSKRNKL